MRFAEHGCAGTIGCGVRGGDTGLDDMYAKRGGVRVLRVC